MSHPRRRKLLFRVAATSVGIVVAFIVLEVFCRVYEPLRIPIRGGRIVLPTSVRRQIRNDHIEKIDRVIVHSRNRHGFRGPETPDDFKKHMTIVAVGGSTTECYYLSDGHTWPEQMAQELDGHFAKSWVNNAGLDGQSTFGHARLLDQYLAELRPDLVLFLIGLNDVGLLQPVSFDSAMNPGGKNLGLLSRSWHTVVEFSAVAALIDNSRRSSDAKRAGVVHGNISHEQLLLDSKDSVTVSETETAELLELHRKQFLPGYCRRIEHLIQLCRAYGIRPVLITQPALIGVAIDPTTGVDLGEMRVGDVNGKTRWKILELYNDVVRNAEDAHDVQVVDLARLLSRDSKYYYDHYHFTNEGAERVAQLVAKQLIPRLAKDFQSHVKSGG